MPQYEVEVTRTVSETKTFRVTADNAEEAKCLAVDAAANTHFNNPGCPSYEPGLPGRVMATTPT